MHILIATPYLPWPLDAGGKVAQFSTLECLSRDHSYTIVYPAYSQKEAEGIAEIEQRLPNVRVKAVPFYRDYIHINYSRLRDFMRSSFSTLRKLVDSNEPNIEATPHYPYYPFTPLPASFIQVLTEELAGNVDLLQVEFVEMLSLGSLKVPNIPKIFVNHQIHWIYAYRYLQVNKYDPYSDYLARQIMLYERMFLREFDSVIVFSEVDAKEISKAVDKNKIYVSPFPIPSDIDINLNVANQALSRKNFSFVGSEGHGPNQDALEWLISDIWPIIRASIPQSQLFVIGNWGKKWQLSHQVEGIIHTGFVEDIAKVMQNTIQLVPVRVGSGIRTKILSAMALGVPVISTTIGIEGIQISNFEQALVVDSADDFAHGAINLATNSILANHIASKALEFVRENYSSEVVRKTRNTVYEMVTSSR